jgi:hypothetical protein
MGIAVVIGIVVVIGSSVAIGVLREMAQNRSRAVPYGTRAAETGTGPSVRTPHWRTSHWRAVATIAADLARAGFPAASGLVAATLIDRCREIGRLAAVVDRRGSAVDSMLHEDLVTELALLERAQRNGSGAVVLVRWPRSREDRVAMAAELTGAEWAELYAHDAALAERLFRELPPRTTGLPVVEPA